MQFERDEGSRGLDEHCLQFGSQGMIKTRIYAETFLMDLVTFFDTASIQGKAREANTEELSSDVLRRKMVPCQSAFIDFVPRQSSTYI